MRACWTMPGVVSDRRTDVKLVAITPGKDVMKLGYCVV